MGKRLSIFVLAAGLSPSVDSLQSQLSELRTELRRRASQNESFIHHQIAAVQGELKDAITERRISEAEQPLHRRRYERARQAATGGLSESVFLELELAAKTADLEVELARWKVKSLEAKLEGLESLRDGKAAESRQKDHDAVLAQLRWYDGEVAKARLKFEYADRHYQRVRALAGSGAVSGARELELELEAKRAEITHAGWLEKRRSLVRP